jgi:hypothetical protein
LLSVCKRNNTGANSFQSIQRKKLMIIHISVDKYIYKILSISFIFVIQTMNNCQHLKDIRLRR